VIPFPGTPDASPTSEIIFSSLKPSDLRAVTVRGSGSGPHPGTISALPADAGTSFTPAQPFSAGERVTVTATLASPEAGTESGDPGATRLRFTFTVAVPGASGTAARSRNAQRLGASGTAARTRNARRRGASSPLPVTTFHSAHGLRPPRMTLTADRDHRAGDIFLTAQIGTFWAGRPLQGGPMILDSHGRLVWFHPLRHLTATNLEVQRYLGHPVLTWWQGNLTYDAGGDVILNQSYRPVATLRGAEGYRLDLHEFQITPQGTALVDAYVPVQANLTSVGGPRRGVVMDCVIQELDIKTGKLLWEWHALGHVPLSDSYLRPSGSTQYDYFHLNSIQQLPGHRLLVSARNTWTVYEIDQRTGRIIWRLGGRRSSFRMSRGTRFEWQHDARLAGNRLSLFDDADSPQEEPQSSGKSLHIDSARMTVSLAHRYRHSPPLLSSGAGSMQVLPDRNVFVGWGSQPNFSEYTAGGHQIFDGSFPLGMGTFRAYRFPWTGRPATAPALAVRRSHGELTVYASWNGDTQVASWRVLGGARAGHLRVMAHRSRTGFETTVRLRSASKYVAVEALNGSGRLLATSRVRAVAMGAAAAATEGTSAGTVIRTVNNSLYGRLLTTSGRYTLYAFCTTATENCKHGRTEKGWTPLIAHGRLAAADGVKQSRLGTRKLADGARQVTYYGQPLYRDRADRKPLEVKGEGRRQGNGAWYVVGVYGEPLPPPQY
jgi:predicted lipoprotein with Yx(FWY)xxD motif